MAMPACGQSVVYPGGEGIGKGKHIVLISGDEEYRSEEALPQLGKILSVHHGFKCTVLFPINPKDGTIDPNYQTNIPGMEALDKSDMMVLALRFRELPDKDMKHFVDFVNSGKPVMGLRTSTHAFQYKRNNESPYEKYSTNSRTWKGGFGRQVLGETWIDHHGHHGRESTRGVINKRYADHAILRGGTDIWGPTDVYRVRNLTSDVHILIHGQVVAGMKPADPPVEGGKNDPMMPLMWTKIYEGESGYRTRVFCTTMGAAPDLESEGVRRVLVNACMWCLELDPPTKSKADVVGEFKPTPFGFNRAKKGTRPSDYDL